MSKVRIIKKNKYFTIANENQEISTTFHFIKQSQIRKSDELREDYSSWHAIEDEEVRSEAILVSFLREIGLVSKLTVLWTNEVLDK